MSEPPPSAPQAPWTPPTPEPPTPPSAVPPAEVAPAEVVPEVVPADADGDGWQRLDVRMLLVGPVQTLRQFAFPAVIALVGISSQGGFNLPLTALTLAVPVLLGFLPWVTTRYRMTETQFQLRKGLLNRQQVTAPLDRVRSVDLEASLMHRLLGLTKVKIGTGVDETRIELNALSTVQADELRGVLLARSRRADLDQSASNAAPDLQFLPNGRQSVTADYDGRQGAPPVPRPAYDAPQLLAEIDWSWLKFAPFSLSKLAIVAGAVGALAQFGDELPFLDAEHADAAWQWALGFAIPLLVLSVLLGGLAGWLVISITGYVVQWWNLRLTREHGTIRLTAGAFTTRSTSVQEARVRGVELTEPVLLRLVKGGELSTLATGVGSGGVTKVLPPCPREVCQQVGHAILHADAPLGRAAPAPRAGRPPAVLRAQPVADPHRVSRLRRADAGARPARLAAGPDRRGRSWPPGGCSSANLEYRHLGHLLADEHLARGPAPCPPSYRSRARRHHRLGRPAELLPASSRPGDPGRDHRGRHRAGRGRDLPLPRAVELAHVMTPDAVGPFLAG